MKVTRVFYLAVFFIMIGLMVQGADCSKVPNDKKFRPGGLDPWQNHIKVVSAKCKETDEIRRPTDETGSAFLEKVNRYEGIRKQRDAKGEPKKVDGNYTYEMIQISDPVTRRAQMNGANPVYVPVSLVDECAAVCSTNEGIRAVRDGSGLPVKNAEGNFGYEKLKLDSGSNATPKSGDFEHFGVVLENTATSKTLKQILDDIDKESISAEAKKEKKARETEKFEEARSRWSVGLWMPFVEPPPVVRGSNNMLDGTKARIFKNTDGGNYEWVVKDLSDNKFYVFKDVTYTWTFEKSDREKAPGYKVIDGSGVERTDGNAVGAVKLAKWYPWFNELDTMDDAQTFIPSFAKDQGGSLSETKVYPNHHTTTYDSGIQGNTTVAESSILQQVMLSLKYKKAEVKVKDVSGNGYPDGTTGSADQSNGERSVSTLKLEEEPLDASFSAELSFEKDLPAAYNVTTKENAAMWTLGKGVGYKLIYVEDYRAPTGGSLPYTGNNGETAYKTVVGGSIDKDVQIYTEDLNSNANKQSDEMKAKMKYYLGNGDIYKIENPFFGSTVENETKNEPYLNFFLIKGNQFFGPYTCGVQKDRWDEWYVGATSSEQPFKSEYWSQQPPKQAEAYVKSKMANAFASKHIPPWHLGVVFLTLGTDGVGQNGMQITEELNKAWTAGSVANFTFFNDILKLYSDMGSKNPAAQKAVASLKALQKVIEDPQSVGLPASFKGQDQRKWYRFALTGYDSGLGSFCVGPQPLEKFNPAVYQEVVGPSATSKGVDVLMATWTIHKERVIMPSCYCSKSTDKSKTDLFTSKQIMEVVLADCCGAMTTVNPSTENTREGVEILDEDSATTQRTAPVPEMTIGNGQTEQTALVPALYELGANDKLVVNGTKYGPGEYKGQFDMTAADFKLEKDGNTASPISFFTNPTAGDMMVMEDERIEIKTGGYDNIDGMTSFRGLKKSELSIKAPDGTDEVLEYVDENGVKQNAPKIERNMNVATPFQFDPAIKLFHVFRNPGEYTVKYRVTEATGNQFADLVYKIKVVEVKTQNRTIEDQNKRQ